MKHIIRFAAGSAATGAETLELDADSIQVQPPGLLVLVKDNQAVGTFPLHGISGVWTPDGPAQVQLATPGVTL